MHLHAALVISERDNRMKMQTKLHSWKSYRKSQVSQAISRIIRITMCRVPPYRIYNSYSPEGRIYDIDNVSLLYTLVV